MSSHFQITCLLHLQMLYWHMKWSWQGSRRTGSGQSLQHGLQRRTVLGEVSGYHLLCGCLPHRCSGNLCQFCHPFAEYACHNIDRNGALGGSTNRWCAATSWWSLVSNVWACHCKRNSSSPFHSRTDQYCNRAGLGSYTCCCSRYIGSFYCNQNSALSFSDFCIWL